MNNPMASSAVKPFFNCTFSIKTGLMKTAHPSSIAQLSALDDRSASAISSNKAENTHKTVDNVFFKQSPSQQIDKAEESADNR